ncbi:hypothetical protein EHV15_35790 [Paenibacillus oralis]|uniref:Uncharacterized protein n=1 Tax=Paenibacillus oralis TaxID=2490856 RepID=A0A3P3TA55_9BACL|nr:hypothetical protein [Paenibacillus oralis]RRJ54935.1 hypothetical protein EHV15_35790 [Paenibacillus oralis]
MSNNYYFRSTEDANNVLGGAVEIHIGQYAAHSCLLMRQDTFYKSVIEIEAFYLKNKDNLEIVDECDRTITWAQLQTRLLSAGPRFGHRYIEDEAGYTWSKEEFC